MGIIGAVENVTWILAGCHITYQYFETGIKQFFTGFQKFSRNGRLIIIQGNNGNKGLITCFG